MLMLLIITLKLMNAKKQTTQFFVSNSRVNGYFNFCLHIASGTFYFQGLLKKFQPGCDACLIFVKIYIIFLIRSKAPGNL